MTGNSGYPSLEEIGWGYPKELLGTRSRTSVTVRPLRAVEQGRRRFDFRKKHIAAYEDVLYEVAMRREKALATYPLPEEMEMLIRHLQGWIETNSAAMRLTQGFWMEYLGTDYPRRTKLSTDLKIYTAIVRLRFHSARGVS